MTKKLAVVLTGAGLALAASGCSGGAQESADGEGGDSGMAGGGAGPMAIVTEAVNHSTEADSYTATLAVTTSAEGQQSQVNGDVEYTVDPEPTMRMETNVAGQDSTVLMRGSEILVRGATQQLGGAEWLRVNGVDAGVDLTSQDPLSEVEKLLAAQDVTESGTETIDGVATTVYTGSYATDEAVQQIQDPQMAEAAEQHYAGIGADSVDFEVFVADDTGLPLRVTTTIQDFSETTLDFTSFNEPVEIEYPAEEAIGDFDEMMQDLEEGMQDPDTTF